MNLVWKAERPKNVHQPFVFKRVDCLAALQRMPDSCVDAIITSPPYFRKFSYGDGPGIDHGLPKRLHTYLGLQEFAAHQFRRILKPTGTLWYVIQDSANYSGGAGGDYAHLERKPRGPRESEWGAHTPLLIPERIRLIFTDTVGLVPVQKIVWNKLTAQSHAQRRLGESVEEIHVYCKDRALYKFNREAVLSEFSEKSLKQLERAYTKQSRRDYDATGQADPSDRKRRSIEAMRRRGGALLRNVFPLAPGSQPAAEDVPGLASFPMRLAEIMVVLSTDPGDLVLDPYAGYATTLLAALTWGRRAIGFERTETYFRAAVARLRDAGYE